MERWKRLFLLVFKLLKNHCAQSGGSRSGSSCHGTRLSVAAVEVAAIAVKQQHSGGSGNDGNQWKQHRR